MNKPQKLALIVLATVMILTAVVSDGRVLAADEFPDVPAGLECHVHTRGVAYAAGYLAVRCNTPLPDLGPGVELKATYSPSYGGITPWVCVDDPGGFYCVSTGYKSTPFANNTTKPISLIADTDGDGNTGVWFATDMTDPAFTYTTEFTAFAPPAYAELVGGPLTACESVEYALQVNGTGYDLVQLQDVVVYPSDTIILIVDSNGRYPDDVNLLSWTYRAQPGDIFFRNPVYVATALDEIHTYRIEVKAAQPAGEIEVHCIANDFSDTYLRLGDNNHGATPSSNRACSSLTVFLPEGEYATGDEVVAAFDLDAGPYVDADTGIDLVIWEFVQGGANLETTVVESFDRFGSQIGGGVPYLHHVPIDSDGELRFLMPGDGLATQLEVTCTDTTGDKRILGTGAIEDGTFVVSISGQDSCYAGAGMKATAPSTWVAGIFVGAGCFVETLFVPSDSDLAGQLDRIDGLRDAPPLQWVDEGVTFIGATSISFDTWASAGPSCVDVLGTDICPQTWDSGSGALPAWFLGAFAFGLWSLIVFTVWRFF